MRKKIVIALALACVEASASEISCRSVDRSSPVQVEQGTGMFDQDKSKYLLTRVVCKETGEILLWTYKVLDCDGPCAAATFVDQQSRLYPGWLPQAAPHVCEGCLFVRREAARH